MCTRLSLQADAVSLPHVPSFTFSSMPDLGLLPTLSVCEFKPPGLPFHDTVLQTSWSLLWLHVGSRSWA